MNKTPLPSIDSLERQWYLVDAENQTLGRLADVLISDSNTDIKCDAEFIDVLHQNFLKPLKKRGYFPYEDLLKTYQHSIEAMRA